MRTYERKSFPRRAMDLSVMKGSGRLSFDNAVQRAFVWKNTTKDNKMSMLIDTMMRGLPIPPMYCNCTFTTADDKVYDFVDGKQRVTTIIKFLNDEFALVSIPVFELEDGTEVDLNGMKFSELPEEFRDIIKTYSLTVYYYENMPQDELEEMFRRLNNGKSLSAIELTRVAAKSKSQISELSKHPLFDLALSEKSLAGYANEDIIIKSWILLYGDNKSLETKNIRSIMKEVDITDEQVRVIGRCFDSIAKIYTSLTQNEEDKKLLKIAKKVITKTHLISLIPIMKKSIDGEISEENILAWIKIFFIVGKATTVSGRYNENATSGSARPEAVTARLEEIENSIEEFINKETTDVAQTE